MLSPYSLARPGGVQGQVIGLSRALRAGGHEVTVVAPASDPEGVPEAVGQHYGARSGTGILDCWLIHEGDHAEIDGVAVRSVPLLMNDPEATAEMVSAGLDLAGVAA